MSWITEDARQDAALLLLERGGSASVENPGAFINRTSRYIQARRDFDAARELHELAAAAGEFDSYEYTHYLDMLDARRARVRAWYATLPAERRKVVGAHRSTPEHKAAYMLANREKFNALRRARRAATKRAA